MLSAFSVVISQRFSSMLSLRFTSDVSRLMLVAGKNVHHVGSNSQMPSPASLDAKCTGGVQTAITCFHLRIPSLPLSFSEFWDPTSSYLFKMAHSILIILDHAGLPLRRETNHGSRSNPGRPGLLPVVSSARRRKWPGVDLHFCKDVAISQPSATRPSRSPNKDMEEHSDEAHRRGSG